MKAFWEALIGPDIVVDGSVLVDHSVLVRDGRIQGVVPIGRIPTEVARRELGSGILTAGLVDVHTHGAAGHSFNAGNVEANKQALGAMLNAGITTVLPTLATAPIESLTQGLAALTTVRNGFGLPRIPGAHLEGPYFSQAQRGAQDSTALRAPADGSIDQLLDHADIIRMVSFAPELTGAVALTEKLVDQGIVAAAGHSDGREADLLACQKAGLSHVIHIFSGQSTTVRRGPWRYPGMLEATLSSEGLTVEMIADGKHLPPALMKMAHRCLAGRLCIVSDSTPGAGMPDGSIYRMGAMEYIVEDGVGMTLDRTSFGGSTTLVSQMLPIAIETLGLGLAEAIAMVTSIPAAAARVSNVGRIAPGFHADFALFDPDLRLRSVALAGQWQETA
ncbi:N-acetylglucosamine-6-phosphate deacetylase [Cryobacterium aureum]|uniref:N-acetylglucosamine-6-phosphate deacetylase n=1 Tax=Cryobacterium aureum TaxID=995037 RepID=UPI000CF57FDC|nr:amidohydrolase family protein [Cryobacterium aureum]